MIKSTRIRNSFAIMISIAMIGTACSSVPPPTPTPRPKAPATRCDRLLDDCTTELRRSTDLLEKQTDYLTTVNGRLKKDKIRAGLIGFSVGVGAVVLAIIPLLIQSAKK